MEDLDRCRFCGSNAVLITGCGGISGFDASVSCEKKCRSCDVANVDTLENAIEKVIECWNWRRR